jgi:hypothetical protein
MKVVEQFAAALDREDYGAARALLSPDCTYQVRSKVLRGPDSIVGSYKANGEWGAANIDSIEYRSHIEENVGKRFVVRYEDHLLHSGKRLTHACQQLVELDASGRISRIEHMDLPGEREALEAFFRETGIARRSWNA